MNMNNKHKQHPTLVYEDLTVKIVKGKYGEYTYKSPLYGYKRAHKYNTIIYIYLTDKNGFIEQHPMINGTRKNIVEYLKEFKTTSRRYQKAIKFLV